MENENLKAIRYSQKEMLFAKMQSMFINWVTGERVKCLSFAVSPYYPIVVAELEIKEKYFQKNSKKMVLAKKVEMLDFHVNTIDSLPSYQNRYRGDESEESKIKNNRFKKLHSQYCRLRKNEIISNG